MIEGLPTEMGTVGFSEDALLQRVEEIRTLGRQYGLSKNQIEECLGQVISEFRHRTNSKNRLRWQTMILVILFILLSYWLIACHKPTQTLVSRNIQDLIYPFMRILRLSTLWIHNRLPQITVWHEQQCLIDNPWYRNLDLSCWPCEQMRTVTDLTNFPNYIEAYLQNGIPFILKEGTTLSLEQLEKLYSENENDLNFGTGHFRSNIPLIKDIKDIFEYGKSQKLYEYNKIHIEWQLKRVSAARVLRKNFPRPHFVPNNTEVALERYLFIDGPSSLSYSIPLTEFANVWLHQRIGRRVVTFQPSPHCESSCTPMSTVIFAGDILFYNWQYWRLQFHPSASSLSLTYMGSFY
ncbi:hypothetical protein CHUAL_012817 [Chamberlinius hualienensis]